MPNVRNFAAQSPRTARKSKNCESHKKPINSLSVSALSHRHTSIDVRCICVLFFKVFLALFVALHDFVSAFIFACVQLCCVCFVDVAIRGVLHL